MRSSWEIFQRIPPYFKIEISAKVDLRVWLHDKGLKVKELVVTKRREMEVIN